MNQRKYIISCIIIFIFSVESVKLPTYFTKCNSKDSKLNECVLKNIQDNWNKFIEGDNYYHIQKLNPLFVPIMYLEVDDNLSGNLTNGHIQMNSFKFLSVNMDLENKVWRISFSPEICILNGTFISNGKLFGLPISGGGIIQVTFYGGVFSYNILYNLNEKNKKHHIHIHNSSIDYDYSTIKNVNFKLDFGRGSVGDILSDTLNKNWREVTHDLSKSLSKAVGSLFSIILNDFFSRVSYEELFSNEIN